MNSQDYTAKQIELDNLVKEIEADRIRRIVRELPVRTAREQRRLCLERELAAEGSEPYAEELPLNVSIGDEWYLVSNGVNPLLFCGSVNENTISLFSFLGTEEFRLSGLCDDVDINQLRGKGLGAYGLFVVRNSLWKAQVLGAMAAGLPTYDPALWGRLEHFIIRGKGGECVCLAREVEQRVLPGRIESVRERLADSRSVLALLNL